MQHCSGQWDIQLNGKFSIIENQMKLSKEQISFIESHKDDDVGHLALLFGGKGRNVDCTLEGDDLRFALMQVDVRQRLKDKLPTILTKREFVFPSRISTEQASSEATAKLKAEILDKLNIPDYRISADLTGGLGIDSIFMAKKSKKHHYVEINTNHSAAAENNLPLFLNNAIIHNTDAANFLKNTDEEFDFVYADPARRDNCNSKVFKLEDCSPNILELKPQIMHKSKWLIVKLSPMLDVTQAIEKLEAEKIVIVSVNNECKEMIAICGKSAEKECVVEAVEINKKGIFIENIDKSDNLEIDYYGMPESGMYLYEPYAAMMKAGRFKELAVRYDIKMIAPSSHLYFSKERINFPGREFLINDVTIFSKQAMKGIKKANITTRNFPMSVAEVKHRFKVEDGGNLYLFLTTDNLGRKLLMKLIIDN